jgi:hypothetical protein
VATWPGGIDKFRLPNHTGERILGLITKWEVAS